MTPGRTLAKFLLIPTLALIMGESDPVYSQTSGVKKNFSAQSAQKGLGKYLLTGQTDSTYVYKQFLSEKLLTAARKMSKPMVSVGYVDIDSGEYEEIDYEIQGNHIIMDVQKRLVDGEQRFTQGLKETNPKGASAPYASPKFSQVYNDYTLPKPGELGKLRKKVKGLLKKVDEIDEGYDKFGKDLEELKKRAGKALPDTTYEDEPWETFPEDTTYEDEDLGDPKKYEWDTESE